jgi:5-methylthioribose kinase
MNEELIKALKQRKEEWSLLKEDLQSQEIWVQQNIIPQIVRLLLSNEEVLELVVLEDIAEAVNNAVKQPVIGLDFLASLGPQVASQADTLKTQLEDFIPKLSVKAEIVDKFINPRVGDLPAELLFIVIVTGSMIERQNIELIDQQLGFTKSLMEGGMNINFSPSEKKLIFGVAHAMTLMVSNARNQVKLAQASSRGGELITPF